MEKGENKHSAVLKIIAYTVLKKYFPLRKQAT